MNRVSRNSKLAQPEIAETDGAAMSTKPERPSADLLFVFRQDAVAGFAMDSGIAYQVFRFSLHT